MVEKIIVPPPEAAITRDHDMILQEEGNRIGDEEAKANFSILSFHVCVPCSRHAIVDELVELEAVKHTCSPNEELNEGLRGWANKGFLVTGWFAMLRVYLNEKNSWRLSPLFLQPPISSSSTRAPLELSPVRLDVSKLVQIAFLLQSPSSIGSKEVVASLD
ncbi:hypothetical protein NE237_031806 [Protea cynaroides]|uniref:Uncharacterized protein n=1 Tax=Protea cynaroides TaxID=273540 RepID=A0A9Q0R2T5_9MAGN|nr:hypothetical protein NE237_031806 [Protea cynaroides]